MASCHVKNNLSVLRQLPRVALNNIRDLPEAFITVGSLLYVDGKFVSQSRKVKTLKDFQVLLIGSYGCVTWYRFLP